MARALRFGSGMNLNRLVVSSCLALLSGCILSPTDDQRVSSTTAPLAFQGFHLNPSGQVQLQAWNYSTHGMANLGGVVTASATSSYSLDRPLYSWSATRTLGPSFWRAGPVSGSCAVIGGNTVISGSRYNLYTFEQDWASCLGANPTVSGFAANCASDHSPAANLYTADWGSQTVDNARLALVAAVASGQISINFDNYTPTAYQFCNAGNPAGCPGGDGSDPETWKYFAPNASFIRSTDPTTGAVTTTSFSIDPSRSGPSTVYIDNMMSRSIGLRMQGGDLVMRIVFESAGVEIRTNCIRDALCAFIDGKSIDFTAPVAAITFHLDVQNDKVVYTSATTSFTSGTAGAEDAETAIATAITEKLNGDPAIHASVNGALDSLVRAAASFDDFPVDSITTTSSTLVVRPACVRD